MEFREINLQFREQFRVQTVHETKRKFRIRNPKSLAYCPSFRGHDAFYECG